MKQFYPGSLIFYSSLFGMLICSPWFLAGHFAEYRAPHQVLLFLRAMFSALAFYLFFIAIQYIPYIEGVLIMNTTPILIPIITFFWMGFKIALRVWLYIILGFIGVVIVLNPTSPELNVGVLWGVAGAVNSSLSIVALGILMKEIQPRIVLFYLFLYSLIVFFPVMLYRGDYMRLADLPYLIILSVAMIAAQLSFLYAYRYVVPAKVAPLNFSGVLFGCCSGLILFQNSPTWHFVVGGSIVVLSLLLTLTHNYSNSSAG
ncbi:MAG: hypothetical protein S4CHLAM102_14280 [Chlamydiia bacterium]|nr:hypothetical protein [Chlamydiia bacterium]